MDQVTPLVEIAAGTLPLIASLLIHGVGMFLVQRTFRTHGIRVFTSGKHEQMFLAGMIVVLLTTHLVEICVWSAALVLVQAVTGFRDAFYYVAGTYTTLGYGEGTLPKAWRLLAPMIAISGLFAFGWTTGVLLNLMSQAAVLNAARDIAASAASKRTPKS
ncbi:MAG: ion channel [Casimicrobiaceae bacterium]